MTHSYLASFQTERYGKSIFGDIVIDAINPGGLLTKALVGDIRTAIIQMTDKQLPVVNPDHGVAIIAITRLDDPTTVTT